MKNAMHNLAAWSVASYDASAGLRDRFRGQAQLVFEIVSRTVRVNGGSPQDTVRM